METPYRVLSEDEKIVIDSRLSSLEKALESRRAWGRITVFVIGILILVVGLLIELRKSREERASCVEEVKFAGTYTPTASELTLKCDHPRHRANTRYGTYAIFVECTCR